MLLESESVTLLASGTGSLLAYLPALILAGLTAGLLMGLAAWQTLIRLAPAWRDGHGEGRGISLTKDGRTKTHEQ